MQNGRLSILKTSECRKIGKGVSLSDILEDEVPKEYFLSAEQLKRIVFQ